MPYSGPDDPDLPDAVKDMPEDKREQWIAVFESALASCLDDGGEKDDCESSAFAQAYSVVNKENAMTKTPTLGEKIRDLGRNFLELFKVIEQQERATAMTQLYSAVYTEVWAVDDWAWINDLYRDNDGSFFVVITSEGKLYRADIVFGDEDEVTVGEWTEIPLDRSAETDTVIIRQTDGAIRWLSVSSTSILNRMGEIDSRELFASFVAHAERTGQYPFRTFYHLGEEIAYGQADYIGVDGYCLITSGLFDLDNPLALAEIEAREREPEYWGESIGFLPTSEPEMLAVTDDVSIPVYNKGILREISCLPESDAAALFTSSATTEVYRMKDKVKTALSRLVDDDEEILSALEEKVDSINRDVEEENLIARKVEEDKSDESEDDTDEEETENDTEEASTEEEISEEETAGDDDLEEETEGPRSIEIDEAAAAVIAQALTETESFQTLVANADEMAAQIADLTTIHNNFESAVGIINGSLAKRLKALERGEDEKHKEWLADLPPRSRLTVTHRPREEAAINSDEETMADTAARTLAEIGE